MAKKKGKRTVSHHPRGQVGITPESLDCTYDIPSGELIMDSDFNGDDTGLFTQFWVAMNPNGFRMAKQLAGLTLSTSVFEAPGHVEPYGQVFTRVVNASGEKIAQHPTVNIHD